ncbi:MAG: hypothetical protein KDK70_15930 [Myxococcales bacterium]|nr:hypothetical protein [Myxococcales bacterium]
MKLKHSTFVRSLLAFAACSTVLLGAVGAAVAAQPGPATDFDGTYGVVCDEATVVVGLQEFQLEAGDGSLLLDTPVDQELSIDFACAPDEIEAEVVEVYGRCMEGIPDLEGIDEDDACALVADTVGGMMEGMAGMVNGTFDVHVRDHGTWVNRVLALYGMDGDFTSLDGDTIEGDFLLYNGGGAGNGEFYSLSVIPLLLPATGLCPLSLATMTTVVDGQIDRTQDYALEATLSRDLSLWCQLPSDDPSVQAAGRVGLTFIAELSGDRL